VFTSVRARTTLVAAVVSLVALSAGSVALVVGLRASLTSGQDDLARARLDDVAGLARRGDLPARLTAGDGVAQVVGTDGRVLAASPNVVGRPPITGFRPEGDRADVRTIVGPDDSEQEQYRLWARRATAPSGEVIVYVGWSTESVREATRVARNSLIVGVPVLLGLLVATTWVLLGRALRPVEAIRSEVSAITDRQLDRRVPVPRGDDEVARLARTMNDMLDRLETASRRQHDFVADASHDLQSPLAAMRALLETHDTADPTRERSETTRRLLAENSEMEGLVQNLLFLARDEAEVPTSRAALDLDDVVLEEATRLRSSTRITVDTSRVSAAPVIGNSSDLRRLVRNLLENAVRHARSRVEVQLGTGDGLVELQVRDDGPGVADVDRDRIFDRFYKADGARRRDGRGSGLGLSIARAVAESHGGDLTLGESVDGALFRLRLPSESLPG
jgi:signal transduction histidine kinase